MKSCTETFSFSHGFSYGKIRSQSAKKKKLFLGRWSKTVNYTELKSTAKIIIFCRANVWAEKVMPLFSKQLSHSCSTSVVFWNPASLNPSRAFNTLSLIYARARKCILFKELYSPRELLIIGGEFLSRGKNILGFRKKRGEKHMKF